MVAVIGNDYKLIGATPFAPNLGAEIRRVDFSKPVPDDQFAEIHDAFLTYQVLFFKEQAEIPPEQHVAFGKRFGDLHAHPAAPTMEGHPEISEIDATRNSKVANGEFWHSDVSCDETPRLAPYCRFTLPRPAAVTPC